MDEGTPAFRSVLSDQIKDRILQAILSGRYPPGDRIVETRVARELGTSQAPVREALRDLSALGVVEISAFRGARVRRPSADELLGAFVVRAELETLGLRLAFPKLGEAHLADLRGYVNEMESAARADDAYRDTKADAAFHGCLMGAAGNGTLERIWQTLEPFSRTYITLAMPGADRRQLAGLHQPILDGLAAGDLPRALEALGRHFEVAATMLGSLWTDNGLSRGATDTVPQLARRPRTRRPLASLTTTGPLAAAGGRRP